jgi:RNA polymerase sigma-70 factor (ECF subfamily)
VDGVAAAAVEKSLFTERSRSVPVRVMHDAGVAEPDCDHDVVRAVYEDVHKRLWRAVLAYSGSRHVADEAVAEAFAQLLRRGSAVSNPEGWVWRSAFRIAAGELAARSDLGSVEDLPEVAAVDVESAMDLLRALSALSSQQRACVVLCDLQDLTVARTADLLGTSSPTVRVQRMRARRRLRVLLEADDVA